MRTGSLVHLIHASLTLSGLIGLIRKRLVLTSVICGMHPVLKGASHEGNRRSRSPYHFPYAAEKTRGTGMPSLDKPHLPLAQNGFRRFDMNCQRKRPTGLRRV